MSSDLSETLPVSPPKMSSSNVPAMLQAGRMKTNISMDVSSDVIDPIVINDRSCRFVIQNKGYLHDGSRITMGVKTNASINQGGFFPVNRWKCYF